MRCISWYAKRNNVLKTVTSYTGRKVCKKILQYIYSIYWNLHEQVTQLITQQIMYLIWKFKLMLLTCFPFFLKMVAEFEKILGLQKSIVPNATANFHQVTEGILQEAKQKAVGKKIEEVIAISVRQLEWWGWGGRAQNW